MESSVKQIAGALVITIVAGALSEGGIKLQGRIEPHTEVHVVNEYPRPAIGYQAVAATTFSGDAVVLSGYAPHLYST
ncbi:MAG: hypothetical protein V1933_04290 [Candidatus Omnitrophota bacterium]